jgi:signal peptidase II
LGSGFTIVFSLFALAVAVFITYFSTRVTSKGWMVVMGLVLGGVFGNLTDRIFREPSIFNGHVIDWIELPNFPVFNVADMAIVAAALVSVLLIAKEIPPFAPPGAQK